LHPNPPTPAALAYPLPALGHPSHRFPKGYGRQMAEFDDLRTARRFCEPIDPFADWSVVPEKPKELSLQMHKIALRLTGVVPPNDQPPEAAWNSLSGSAPTGPLSYVLTVAYRIGQNAMLIASSVAASQAISQKSIVPSCEEPVR
jgi:hypothetical protein